MSTLHIALVAVLLAFPTPAPATGRTLAARSQAHARRVFDAAVKAYGGEAALRAVKSVAFRFEGELNTRLQTPTPEPPYEPGRAKETVTLDLQGGRMAVEQESELAGFASRTRTVVA